MRTGRTHFLRLIQVLIDIWINQGAMSTFSQRHENGARDQSKTTVDKSNRGKELRKLRFARTCGLCMGSDIKHRCMNGIELSIDPKDCGNMAGARMRTKRTKKSRAFTRTSESYIVPKSYTTRSIAMQKSHLNLLSSRMARGISQSHFIVADIVTHISENQRTCKTPDRPRPLLVNLPAFARCRRLSSRDRPTKIDPVIVFVP